MHVAAHLRHTASTEHGLVPQLLVSIYLKVLCKKIIRAGKGVMEGGWGCVSSICRRDGGLLWESRREEVDFLNY